MNLEKVFDGAEHKSLGPSIGKTSTPTGFEYVHKFYAALATNGKGKFNVHITLHPYLCVSPYKIKLFKRNVSQERARREYDKLH